MSSLDVQDILQCDYALPPGMVSVSAVDALKDEYLRLWARMAIVPAQQAAVNRIACGDRSSI
jgi:hypothetical protein